MDGWMDGWMMDGHQSFERAHLQLDETHTDTFMLHNLVFLMVPFIWHRNVFLVGPKPRVGPQHFQPGERGTPQL